MFCGAEASAPWKLRGSSPRSLCPSDDAVADEVFFPLESGYACTLAKVQGAELPAVAILCDVLHVPAAGYVAMSSSCCRLAWASLPPRADDPASWWRNE